MMEILGMTAGHAYWKKTIQFAETCSWRAEPFLANEMRREAFQDWERVFCRSLIENYRLLYIHKAG